MILAGVPIAIGWACLPNADSFGDVRIFLLATLAGMIICFFAPRTRGKVVFVGIALVVAWLWLLGEVAGNDAFSAAPLPSPPANTLFSLAAFQQQSVTLDDLDPDDPLYPLAEDCANGDLEACDDLYNRADFGSDFREYGATCGNAIVHNGGFGTCSFRTTSPPFDFDDSFGSGSTDFPLSRGDDNDLELGLVSTILGLIYLAAFYRLDKANGRGLATAFVAPTALALFSGTQLLGSAAGEPWVTGLLTFVAGIVFGVVGHLGARRFTAWFGGYMAVVGALLIAGDISERTMGGDAESPQLVTPGLIVIVCGVALIAVAYFLTQFLDGLTRPPSTALPVDGPPDPAPEPVGAWTPTAPPAPPSAPPSAWPPAPSSGEQSPWAPPD